MSETTPPSDELRLQPADPPQLPMQICKKCGASNPPHATRCWLCEDSGKRNPYSPARLEPLGSSAATDVDLGWTANARVQGVFSILLGAALLLTIVIGIGLAAQDRGMIVPYLILVGPALLATGLKAMIGTLGQSAPSAGSLLWTFLWSMFLTVGAIILLVVAAIALLFLLCASMGGLNGPL